MKIYFLITIMFYLTTVAQGQSAQAIKNEIKEYQANLNKIFSDKNISPLIEKDRLHFDHLNFFGPKACYRIQAKFIRSAGSEPFEMRTTTKSKPIYEKYGELHFEIKGRKLRLSVYQSHDARRNPLYRTKLFLPFKDLTNSNKTYGGGRIIDIDIPKNESVVIDFNKAYNPYCAYSPKYSCPIVPKENHLEIAIKAGMKKFKGS